MSGTSTMRDGGGGSLDAARITAASKSNLAFAFFCLPADRRRDMATFYAFCRLADDIADNTDSPPDQRRADLAALRAWIDAEDLDGLPVLARALRGVVARRGLDPARLHAILDGVARDISPTPFDTMRDLLSYCHLVAAEVGLVSIAIFGCRHPDAATYAVQLGYALQLTNILRDVGEDHANGGRLYLPLEDLARFHIAPDEIARIEDTQKFRDLMEFEHDRALGHYQAAVRARPKSERRRLASAEIMRCIYARLLDSIRRDGFRVISRRHSLGLPAKLTCAARALAGLA